MGLALFIQLLGLIPHDWKPLAQDTCATNFMIRDEKMKALVAPDKEPITAFVRSLGPEKP